MLLDWIIWIIIVIFNTGSEICEFEIRVELNLWIELIIINILIYVDY